MPEDKPTVLEEAQALVYGERAAEYGHPRVNFNAIARLWDEYLGSKYGTGEKEFTLNAEDAAMLLLLLKIARIATGDRKIKRDTVADMAGYVAVFSRVAGIDD